MDRGLAVVLTAVVGGFIALQAPINSQLGRSVGTFQAAFFSFAIGTVLLLAIAAVARGGLGQIGEARHLAPHYLLGGVLGAAYVTTVLVSVRTLGAGGVTAATIAGQLTHVGRGRPVRAPRGREVSRSPSARSWASRCSRSASG